MMCRGLSGTTAKSGVKYPQANFAQSHHETQTSVTVRHHVLRAAGSQRLWRGRGRGDNETGARAGAACAQTRPGTACANARAAITAITTATAAATAATDHQSATAATDHQSATAATDHQSATAATDHQSAATTTATAALQRHRDPRRGLPVGSGFSNRGVGACQEVPR